MPQQISFAQAEYAAKRKLTRRDRFLGEMAIVVPWARLLEALRPHDYPTAGQGPGRPPMGLERMLRLYFLQQWFGLADEALEDAVYDSQAFRGFLGLDLGREAVPDATTLLKFRHLLETNGLTQTLFDTINALLRERGLLMNQGTLVDTTIIAAPSSTKNKEQTRDPEMGHTCKGKQYYFGAKAHIGVDEESGLVHSTTTTAANVADITETANLLHGEEEAVFADAGYTGAEQREELKDRQVKWYIAAKRGKVAALPEGEVKDLTKRIERIKAHVRSRVEHVFHILKDRFHYRKLRYKGLKKNGAQQEVLFALANLIIAKQALLAVCGVTTPARGVEDHSSHPECPK
ncbi:MAG: IS5 family transposase [Chromatiaceae bacterium]